MDSDGGMTDCESSITDPGLHRKLWGGFSTRTRLLSCLDIGSTIVKISIFSIPLAVRNLVVKRIGFQYFHLRQISSSHKFLTEIKKIRENVR